jgi:hypothetical protein
MGTKKFHKEQKAKVKPDPESALTISKKLEILNKVTYPQQSLFIEF